MDTLSRLKPKATREHKCDWCNGIINKGEIYEKTNFKYEGVFTWKNHIKCSEIAGKLNMFDNCDEGLSSDDFKEYINIEFCEIWRKKDIEFYESKDFKIPSFLEQLDFVCNFHLKKSE